MNAEPIEIVWTTVNVLGFLVTLFATGDALGDLRLVRRQAVNGPRRIIARANFRRELMRTLELGLFSIAGMTTLFVGYPSPPQARLITVACLIVGAMMISVSAVMDRIVRYRIINYDEASTHFRRSTDAK